MFRTRRARTRWGLLAVAAFVTLLVPARSPSASPAVTLTFVNWASAEPATRPAMQETTAAFEHDHPGVQIRSVPVSFSDILHQLIVQTAAGNPPDVAQIAGNDTVALQATGALQSLDGIAPSSFLESLYPNEVALGRFKGSLYAIPWIVAPLGFWYNRTLMRRAGLDPSKPPATIPEWMADLGAIKARDPGVVPFGLDTTNRSFGLDVNWPFMLDFGAHPLAATRPNADTPQMIAYLLWVRSLAQRGYTLPGKLLGEFRPLAARGELAFAFDGPYLQGVILSLNKSLSPAQFYDTWGVTVLPAGAAGGRHYTIPTDHQLVMFKAARDKAAAWAFMQYLASDRTAILDYTFQSGVIPPLKDATALFPKQMDNPIIQAYVTRVIPTVVRPAWGAVYSKAFPAIMTGVQQAVSGADPVASIASAMQTQLQDAYH
jgi:multiple sugar transport system substrate-binding protein